MSHIALSKSKYAAYCQCPKLLWLSQFRADEATPDPQASRPTTLAFFPPNTIAFLRLFTLSYDNVRNPSLAFKGGISCV